MRKRETEFTDYKFKNIFIGTFNCNATRVSSFEDLKEWIKPESSFDDVSLWVFGFQEIVELKASQVWNADTTNTRAWEQIITSYLNSKRTSKVVLLKSQQLVGMLMLIFAAESELDKVQNVVTSEVKVGFSGVAGNKGAVCTSLTYYDSSICLICCHMAADQKYFYQRVSDYKAISQTRFGLSKQYSKVINEHDFVFWFGDMNWRIDVTYEQAIRLIRDKNFGEMYKYDQLMRAQRDNLAFIGFLEEAITFPPTYKFDNGTSTYDTSQKRRIPAWTDRVLYKSPSGQFVECNLYQSAPLYISDHTPVRSQFQLSVKETNQEMAKAIESELYIKSKEYDALTLEQQQDSFQSLI